MPLSDFYECMLYEQIEPFGGRRGDLQAGLIASTIANIYRTKNTPPFSPSDFMPNWQGQATKNRPQSIEEQMQVMDLLTLRQNAIIEARKNK